MIIFWDEALYLLSGWFKRVHESKDERLTFIVRHTFFALAHFHSNMEQITPAAP